MSDSGVRRETDPIPSFAGGSWGLRGPAQDRSPMARDLTVNTPLCPSYPIVMRDEIGQPPATGRGRPSRVGPSPLPGHESPQTQDTHRLVSEACDRSLPCSQPSRTMCPTPPLPFMASVSPSISPEVGRDAWHVAHEVLTKQVFLSEAELPAQGAPASCPSAPQSRHVPGQREPGVGDDL